MSGSFSSRVLEAKARYTRETGQWPNQLFLGPAEYMEFKELLAEYATIYTAPSGRQFRDGPGECHGMTIIGLASDGLRVGHTVE